jgi:hypothetical protein
MIPLMDTQSDYAEQTNKMTLNAHDNTGNSRCGIVRHSALCAGLIGERLPKISAGV